MGCLLGLRYEECVMMRWDDLALDSCNPAGDPTPVAHVIPHDGWVPKDGEARTIPIHARALEIFKRHRRSEGYVLCPWKQMPKHQGTVRVYRYDPDAVWRRVLAAVIAAGGRRITPNGMRHSFASNLLINGVSDTLVARWLGHADTSLVHARYGHLVAYLGEINQLKLERKLGAELGASS